MKTSAIFLAVASVIAGVIAAPQPAPAPPALAANEIQATLRTDGNTTYTASSDFSVLAVRTSRQCSARNFGGTCYRFTFDSGVCWSYSDFGSTVYNALNDKTSSIDNFGATCTFYQNTNCGGRSYRTPYNADLAGEFNDIISSFRC